MREARVFLTGYCWGGRNYRVIPASPRTSVPFAALLARPRHGDSCLAEGLGSRAGLSRATEPWVAAGGSPFRLGTGS
jgi:hypothetical protein